MGRYSGKTCRLIVMLALTSSFFVVEIAVGYITGSMALVADSFHMLSDVAALIIGLASVRYARKTTSKNTYGWARAEVLGALVNAVFLLALCFSIFVEAIARLIDVEEIQNIPLLLAVGGAGLAVNLIGLLLFSGHGHGHSHGGHSHTEPTAETRGTRYLSVVAEQDYSDSDDEQTDSDKCVDAASIKSGMKSYCDAGGHQHDSSVDGVKPASSSQLNMKGVFLHVMGDALGSVVVIVSGIVVLTVEDDWKYYLDPAMSIMMVGIILTSTIPLLKESARILLQTVPPHIEVDKLKKRLLEQNLSVIAVHELHIWQLAGNRIIASAHIRCRTIQDYMKVAEDIKDFFHREGIHSTTIQPEFLDATEEGADSCILICKSSEECRPNTCCGPQKKDSPALRQRLNTKTDVSETYLPLQSEFCPTDVIVREDVRPVDNFESTYI